MEIPLSVVLATYNEEENLTDCLRSVKSLAEEIIVVDGGSADSTREIAKKFKAKVYQVSNQPIFHVNKQLAADKAKGEWILQLDADERVTPKLSQEIKEKIKQAEFAGYYLPRKNWFLTRFLTKGGQYPDYVIRLFRRGRGRFPCQSVHEQIKIQGKVGHLKNPLIHLADKKFSHYLLRFNRYTSLDADRLFTTKVRPGAMSYLIIKPLHWFLLTYFRHKGFVDGLPGFIFSFMSSLRFPVIYLKLWEKYHAH
jgi:glycosyltransferase involved in cell wall biosynthesis